MKKYILILSVAMMLGVSACSLDQFPDSDIVTDNQKDEVTENDPSKVVAEINGLAAGLIKLNTLELSSTQHFDFGYPAVSLMLDASGADFVASDIGYNWFSSSMLYRDRLSTSRPSEMIWRMAYNNIKGANDILIKTEGMDATTAQDERTIKMYKGQAHANRAFSYMLLVQAYQYTYIGHEDAPAVPLRLTEGDERATAKRATVKQVYDVILSDLNEAIELLEGSTRKEKSKVSQQVAYGLRARANLLMNNWEGAAKDAAKAQLGFRPLSLEEVGKPGFTTANSDSWMWANVIDEDNDVVKTGIVNWPSHLCSFTGNGYTTATGTYRRINQPLWEEIPATDIRKQWWADERLSTTLANDIMLNTSAGPTPAPIALGWQPYTNAKFHAYNNEVMNTTNASDWPIMRVEEMIFIEAEALAMSGDLGRAKQVLTDFIVANRDPEYVSKASSSQEFQDEVWMHRRVELWGEGFALFDILRLKKPLIRAVKRNGEWVSTYDSTCQFNLEPEADNLIFLIPEKEIEGNIELSPADNNPTAILPKPVARN